MRTLTTGSRVRNGLMGVVLTVLAIGVGQSLTTVPMLFALPKYYGEFSEAGGLNTGDVVRLNGMDVGSVTSIKVDDDRVRVGFTLGATIVGTDSRLSIRTDTILGKKTLEVDPQGSTALRANDTLPLGQSTTPYQIYDAFDDLARSTGGWDIESLRESLNVLSDTVTASSPQLSAALDGVAEFSDTIGTRDDQLNDLLDNADQVAAILGDRSDDINQLIVNAQALLAKFNAREAEIDALLGNVAAVSTQVAGVIADNPNLNAVLVQLRTLTQTLADNKTELTRTLATVDRFVGAISEAVASGPYFKVMVANLLPGQFLQPFIDAAFKNRGIDPQKFWGDAGLPAFQFPDPNGQRFPNGAPPPAPAPREGTPESAGPAVEKGSPCSYTPAVGALPTPGDPLPCSRETTGPFGDNPYGPNYGPPRVDASTPQPDSAPAPGVPAAALPGQPPPPVPGTPVPLPDAPPGARTAATPPAPTGQ
ncbi:phospholipid/cholesterol/gamma-HCH transport system substrate-binding protein [Mycolicibacterium iranicum]|uniref:Phospholipid/cholesterol/gamma-HCH transport system substrate-binding protein n=1 Tax=Mycolicibacterium iranicum TaxID=912594 RepID=A0A839Q6C3_MYCIR|nr:MCE family protein [Mycolicibacterium iranicum]MBB2989776.1 phospholipid/cholesterol/gamma-HCH transport system substrate-binding protein [Mycolicibacterium iranicum]